MPERGLPEGSARRQDHRLARRHRTRLRTRPRPGRVPSGLPRTPADGDEGRRRLADALRRPGRTQVVVGLLLALVGFGAVTQVRTNQTDDTYAGLRQQDLIDLLNGLAGTSQRAQDEIQRLERTREGLLSDATARQAALQQARQQSETLGILAGVVPAQGPGLEITITEDTGEAQVGPFLDMVESLRTAGAEAMSINDRVRVVAQTSLADGDGGLLVDGRLLTPPYTVDVIGDPALLASALRFPDGPQDEFAADGASLTYTEQRDLTIDTVRPDRPG